MDRFTEILWSDEFDSGDGRPDPRIWSHAQGRGAQGDGWGNNELQYYVDHAENAFVSDGTLKIRALRTPEGGWTSARVHTKGKREWTYGRCEVRARLPLEAGTWPAIWLMPAGVRYGGRLWPDNGEIDIMEHCQLFGTGTPFGTLHRASGFGSRGWQAGRREFGEDVASFHTYAVEWDRDGITWLYDGERLQRTYRREDGDGWAWWPFDQPFYLILNLAMGGNLGGAVDPSLEEAVMEVEWVRVWGDGVRAENGTDSRK